MKAFLRMFKYTFLFILMLTGITVSVGAESATSGSMLTYYGTGSTVMCIVNNTWEYVPLTKTLYIRANTDDYNETGRPSYDKVNNGWAAFTGELEHVVLEGTFAKCSGGAFLNCTKLKDIYISDNTAQFDGSCFQGCTSLESITVTGDAHIKGFANLDAASSVGANAFLGTKLTDFKLGNTCVFNGLNHFPTGNVTIYAPKNSTAETYAKANNIQFSSTSDIILKIIMNGETVYNENCEWGTCINFGTYSRIGMVLYDDAACTVLHSDEMLKQSCTLYAKPIIRYLGSMVRVKDYQGLRAIFEVDMNALASTSYVIDEFGALAKPVSSVRLELDTDTTDKYESVVYSDGKFLGYLTKTPGNEHIATFAYTAVGFENTDGNINSERADKNLMFRGYVKVRNTATNETRTVYTEINKQNLFTACDSTMKEYNNMFAQGNELLTGTEKAFIEKTLALDLTPNRIYTKQELINVLKTVYDDDKHYIVGQHIGSSRNSLKDYLDDVYEASGEYPGLVAMDISEMTMYNKSVKTLIADSEEFISRGGIISFSYHMANPTGNWTSAGLCRGYLGGSEMWDELVTPGTTLNTTFNATLDIAARVLKDFDSAGYPVIWRPFHENNGGWFWWCTIQKDSNGNTVTIDNEHNARLWKYGYDYMTKTWGMKNLVFAYSPNNTNSTTSPMPVLHCYPGDDYVDIAGIDWYSGGDYEIDGTGQSYANIMTKGKIGALTEFGPNNSLQADTKKGEVQEDIFSCMDELVIMKRMQKQGYRLSYVLNWNGWFSLHKLGKMSEFMTDEMTYGLSDTARLFSDEWKKSNK